MGFFLAFISDIYYSLVNKTTNEEDIVTNDDRIPEVTIAIKVICVLFLLYFVKYEIKSAMKQDGYFKEVWNMFDFLLIAMYIPISLMDYLRIYYIATTIGYSILVAIVFMKINFFLRIFDGFSFLVSMMSGVFADIKYFLAFWIIFLAQFAIIFTILF
jgi:hypothetical protein